MNRLETAAERCARRVWGEPDNPHDAELKAAERAVRRAERLWDQADRADYQRLIAARCAARVCGRRAQETEQAKREERGR